MAPRKQKIGYLLILLLLGSACNYSFERCLKSTPFQLVGAIERGDLLDLALYNLEIKVDTGAEGAALHAFAMKEFVRDGKDFIQFKTFATPENNAVITVETELLGHKAVRSSSGHMAERPIIKSRLKIGPVIKYIEITLIDRSMMKYRMLLGRKNLDGLLVNPHDNFLLSGN